MKRKFLTGKNVKLTAGFTLIEILITISIIGILASMILVPLGGAKTKAKDARIFSDLDQIRTIGEIIANVNGDYAAVNTNLDINIMMIDMLNEGATNVHRWANASGYCVEARLPGGKWGCVNSGLIVTFDSPDVPDGPPCDGAQSNRTRPRNINCE